MNLSDVADGSIAIAEWLLNTGRWPDADARARHASRTHLGCRPSAIVALAAETAANEIKAEHLTCPQPGGCEALIVERLVQRGKSPRERFTLPRRYHSPFGVGSPS